MIYSQSLGFVLWVWPDTDNLNNQQTREGISFVSTPAVDNIYDEIGAVETTTAHLG